MLEKNCENVLEKIEGRLKKWKWLLPSMSCRGRTLALSNLVSSSLWYKLTCVDPPSNLLSQIQAALVDSFGINCSGFLRLFFFFQKKREDKDSYIWPVEVLLSTFSLFRDFCMALKTWYGDLWHILYSSAAVSWPGIT